MKRWVCVESVCVPGKELVVFVGRALSSKTGLPALKHRVVKAGPRAAVVPLRAGARGLLRGGQHCACLNWRSVFGAVWRPLSRPLDVSEGLAHVDAFFCTCRVGRCNSHKPAHALLWQGTVLPALALQWRLCRARLGKRHIYTLGDARRIMTAGSVAAAPPHIPRGRP